MLRNGDYRMPAEWEPHERTLIEWPVRETMICSDNYRSLCGGYVAAVKTISQFEPVTVLTNEKTAREAEEYCGSTPDYLNIPHNDAWMRDNGPTFIKNTTGKLAGVSWIFNAWGNKYQPYDLDDKVAERVLRQFGVPCRKAPLVLEGGSIHTDGEGTILTTEQCLLNPNRNPDLSKMDITELLHDFLGITHIIWLKKGLFGDETDGHVDNVACFAAPGVVLMQVCTDPLDPNFESSKENLAILQKAMDASGRPLQIVTIPQPPARFSAKRRLTLSYLNFYLVNGGLILPLFGGDAEKTDREAVRILQAIFPDRRVASVDGTAIVGEGGNIHCITQQMPKGIHPVWEEIK